MELDDLTDSEHGIAFTRKEERKDDPLLLALEVRNLSRAIADGDLAGRWELGAAIGRLLTQRVDNTL